MQGLVSWVEGFPKEPVSGDGIDKDMKAKEELSAKLIDLMRRVYSTGESIKTAWIQKDRPLNTMASKIDWHGKLGRDILKILAADQEVLFRYWDKAYFASIRSSGIVAKALREECIPETVVRWNEVFRARVPEELKRGEWVWYRYNMVLLRALVEQQVEKRKNMWNWLYQNRHFGVTEENRENWKKMFGTVPTSGRKKKYLVERWRQETACWSALSEDEKVALLDMELCCQDLHKIAVKQPLYYPKECYEVFIRCMVTNYIKTYRECEFFVINPCEEWSPNGACQQKRRYKRLTDLEAAFLEWKSECREHPLPKRVTWGIREKSQVAVSRAEGEVLERKIADVEALIQEFFRWIDHNNTKEAEKPVEYTVGKGRQGLRRECLQERIRWVLTSVAEDQRSWIPFQLLLMVVTLGSQVWDYPEMSREVTRDYPSTRMHVPSKRNGPARERLLHLWLLQNLMDLFGLQQEERIPLWTRYLQIQGIGIASYEEERFWRHVLKRQYELLPCIGFQLYFLNNIWQAVPLRLGSLDVRLGSRLHRGGYYQFYRRNAKQMKAGAKLLGKQQPGVVKDYQTLWSKEEALQGRRAWLEKQVQCVGSLPKDADWDLTMLCSRSGAKEELPQEEQEKLEREEAATQQELKRMILETQCRMCVRRNTVKTLTERFHSCYGIQLSRVLRREKAVRFRFTKDGVKLTNAAAEGRRQ